MRVLRKTYKISVTVQEPGISSPPIDDPFWSQEDMRFLRSVKADEVVAAVRNALTSVPVFSHDNVKVTLSEFTYE